MLHASVCLMWMVHVILGVSSEQPQLYEAPANTTARFGERAVLKCRQGSQNITWTFSSKTSAPHVIAVQCKLLAFAVTRFKLAKTNQECNLSIKKVDYKHLGTYTCQDLSLGDHGYTAVLRNKDDNLALKRDTSQSTIYDGHRSGNAVDGIMSTYSMTNNNPQEWWAVDLEQVTAVGRVRITNTVANPNKLQNFIIALTDERFWNSRPDLSKSSVCKYFAGYPPGGIPINIYCESNTQPGRYLFVLMTLIDHLQMVQLEVYYN